MKFSIIMASYNQVKYIEQAIKSILDQTFQDFELLIIDGNSNDGTVDIIHEYENHPKVKVLIEKDHGLYHARNKGLLKVKGDFVGFLNTDDYYEKDALEQIYKCFKLNPEIDIVYGTSHIIDKEGEFIKVYGDFEFDKKKLIQEYVALPDESTFLKRNILSRIGLYDATFSIVGDWDFWQRAIKLDLRFIHIKDQISNYRHYEETLTFDPKFDKKRFQEVLRLYRKYNDRCHAPFVLNQYFSFYVKRNLKKCKIIRGFYDKTRR